MILLVPYVFRHLQTSSFTVFTLVISRDFTDWFEVHRPRCLLYLFKLIIFVVIFDSGSFLSGQIFSVQESGIFVSNFVKALSRAVFFGFPLREVGLKL